jgi:hypothetical protein|tara:strand:+ start:162 stop:467 length:306 start_codon:yes stop_codon:yes gene_type:complete
MKGLSRETLLQIANGDVEGLLKAEQSYGDSWKKRGGVGAFMMLARKWDRIENQVKKHGWNVFLAMERDRRPEGIADDIKDLRCYLLLIEDFINTTGEQHDP